MSNIDLNTPITNPDLVNLFDEIKKIPAGSEQYNQYMNLALQEVATKANLLAIVEIKRNNPTPGVDGKVTLNQGDTISFRMLGSNDGKTYLPLFTDWDNLRLYDEFKDKHVETMVMPFDHFVSMMNDNISGVVINPFSHNLGLSKEQLLHMKEIKQLQATGATERVIQKETKVLLAEPSPYPLDLTNALIEYAKKNKSIDRLHLKLMNNAGEISFLLIVGFKGDRSEIFPKLAETARPFLKNGMFIDMVSYDDSFGKQAADNKPFYVKKKGLFGF